MRVVSPFALAEMCIAGRMGVTVTELPHEDLPVSLFGESQSRLIVEVAPSDLSRFDEVMHGKIQVIGNVTQSQHLKFPGVDPITIEDLTNAFNRTVVPPERSAVTADIATADGSSGETSSGTEQS